MVLAVTLAFAIVIVGSLIRNAGSPVLMIVLIGTVCIAQLGVALFRRPSLEPGATVVQGSREMSC